MAMMTTTTAPAAVLPAPPVVGEIEACLQTAIAQMPPAAIETARAGPGRPPAPRSADQLGPLCH